MIQRHAQFQVFRKEFGNSFSTTYCEWFLRKMFLMLHSINLPNFIVWLPLLLEIFCNMCIAVVCFNCLWRHKFWNQPMSLIKPFFYMTKKSRKKLKYLEKDKSFLRWNKKHFSTFLTGFQFPKIVSDLRVHLYMEFLNKVYNLKS